MEKEVKELSEQIQSELKKLNDSNIELKAAIEKKAPEEKIKGLVEYQEKAESNFKLLSEQMDKIQIEMKDANYSGKPVDMFADVKKSMTDKAFVSELKKRGSKAVFEVKVGTTMTSATNLSTGVYADRVPLIFREPGVGKAPDRMTTLLDLVSRGSISSDMDTWVERSARNISAASVAEGAAYLQSDLTYINKSQKVERVGHYFKVQNIALEDWDQLLSEIQNEGYSGLERELERQVFVGTGNTPEMQGITDTGIAAAYTDASLTGITTPNHYDAIRAAIMQIRKANYTGGKMAVFINPTEGAFLDLPKNADGVYLMPPFADINGKRVSGIPVYESTLVTAGDLLVGDFSKDLLSIKRGIRIEIFDQNENDALYDRKTIVISCRAVNRIKTPDYNAFVYDAFTDIMTAIQ